jgi:multimeric flavodoxin WrbA
MTNLLQEKATGEITVIAINGSPNREGNTSFLLEQVLRAVAEAGAKTKMFHVADMFDDMNDSFCTACSTPCAGICYKDSYLERVFDELRKADAIVIGSPVYFATVSAQIKAVFDKTRKLRMEKALAGKIGGAVSVGASRFGGQETTVRAVHDMMMVHGMTIVSDASVSATLGHHGVCAQKPAQDDTEAIKSAEVLGIRLVEEALRKAN